MQQEALFGARMEGLAAGRAATEAVSRPPGPWGEQDLYQQRGLDSAKLLALTLTAAGQTQHSPGHAALPLCSEESLPSSLPQDAAPSTDALHKQGSACWEEGAHSSMEGNLLFMHSQGRGCGSTEQLHPQCFCTSAHQDLAPD